LEPGSDYVLFFFTLKINRKIPDIKRGGLITTINLFFIQAPPYTYRLSMHMPIIMSAAPKAKHQNIGGMIRANIIKTPSVTNKAPSFLLLRKKHLLI